MMGNIEFHRAQRMRVASLVSALLLACGGAGSTKVSSSQATKDGFAVNSAHGGTTDPCAGAMRNTVGWDDDTELGRPADVFASVSGTCQAPLVWNRGATDATVTLPAQGGAVALGVTVELDHTNVALTAPSAGAIKAPACAVLEVMGHVMLRAMDGSVDDEGDVTVRYTSEGLQPIELAIEAQYHSGTLGIHLTSRQMGNLVYRLNGAGPACAGQILLEVTESSGGMGAGSIGVIGSWSASGCPLEQSPFDADPDLVAALLDAIMHGLGDNQFPAKWDDGAPATLHVSVEVPSRRFCREAPPLAAVTLPVRATFGTDDDRLASHTTDAEIRATLGDAGEVRSLDLWIDETEHCTTSIDDLSYGLASCSTLDHVELQLGISVMDGTASLGGDGLSAYETDRGSSVAAKTGAADRVRKLSP